MKFDFNNWNVDLIQEPNKLLNKLKSLNVVSKKIKNIKIVGRVFTVDGVEIDNGESIKTKENFERYIEVDEPIIIIFEDDNQLEIDYHDGSSLKVGFNSLPKDIKGNIPNNIDGNVVFSNCLGEAVLGFEVSMQDSRELTYDFTGAQGMELADSQNAYISQLKILLTNEKSIVFSNWYDYGHVFANESNHASTINWNELKEGIME